MNGPSVVIGLTASIGVVMASSCATTSISVWRDRVAVRRVRALRIARRPLDPVAWLSAHPSLHSIIRRLRATADRRRERRQLVDFVDRMVRQLRSGATPVGAAFRAGDGLSIAAPLTDALAAGHGLVEAADRWATETAVEGVELVALALSLMGRLGGASAAVLDGVAASLRDASALEREVVALSSQARASMAVLVAAPVAALVLGASIDRHLLRVVVGSPVGWSCLLVGAALDGVGAWWMHRMVRSAAT